jgi:hypothetical protein
MCNSLHCLRQQSTGREEWRWIKEKDMLGKEK